MEAPARLRRPRAWAVPDPRIGVDSSTKDTKVTTQSWRTGPGRKNFVFLRDLRGKNGFQPRSYLQTRLRPARPPGRPAPVRYAYPSLGLGLSDRATLLPGLSGRPNRHRPV